MHSPAKGARHVWRLVLSQPHPTTKIRLTNYHPFSLTLPLYRAAEERVPHNFQFNFFNCISYAFFFTSAFDNSPNSVLLPASLLLQKVEDFRAIFKYNRSAIIFYSACYRCITWVQQSTQRGSSNFVIRPRLVDCNSWVLTNFTKIMPTFFCLAGNESEDAAFRCSFLHQ